MIPIPWIIPVIFLVAYALGGMAIGVVTGILLCFLLRLKFRGILNDGFLGSFGFLAGFIGTVFVPWPQNTITYYVGDTLVTSTMNSYQHPERVGIVVAFLLPLLRELYRFRRTKSSTSRAPETIAPA